MLGDFHEDRNVSYLHKDVFPCISNIEHGTLHNRHTVNIGSKKA